MKRSKSHQDKRQFEHLSKEIKCDLKKEHDKYISSLFEPEEADKPNKPFGISKKFWSYIKGKRKDNVSVSVLKENGKETCDKQEMANILNSQY